MDKVVRDAPEAIGDVRDGAVVLIGGFGDAGLPFALLEALASTAASRLTLVANNAGLSSPAVIQMIHDGRVERLICTYPKRDDPTVVAAVQSGRAVVELVPQGTLAERIRAAGAGIAGFYTRTAAGTALAAGKETRVFDGEEFVFEAALPGDLALVKAEKGDRWGNLTYRKAARNYNPIVAMAGRRTVAQVSHVVPLGEIDPECVVTPGIFVDRVVEVAPRHPARGGAT